MISVPVIIAVPTTRSPNSEFNWLTGKVIALGKRLGIPTPASNFIYAALKLYKDGPPAA